MADKASENEKEETKKPAGSMLPIIIMLVAMPLTAWLATQFIIVPQIKENFGLETQDDEKKGNHESSSHEAGEGKKVPEDEGEETSAENTELVEKVRVNVKNTNGSRFLYVSYLIKGKVPEFAKIKKSQEKMAKIRDTALGLLMSFDIAELGQIETKNRAGAMMISAFNNDLGGDYIEEIFFTEWTVQ